MAALTERAAQAVVVQTHAQVGWLAPSSSYRPTSAAPGAYRPLGSQELLKNDFVKQALDRCTYELAVTQQRVDIQRAISAGSRRPSTQDSEPYGSKTRPSFHATASAMSKFMDASAASRPKSKTDGRGFEAGPNGTLLTQKRIARLQAQISLKTIALITELQVRYRRKLAKRKRDEEERQKRREELRLIRLESARAMRCR